MVPLLWILFAWLVLVAAFAVMALITVVICVKYGLTGIGTYLSTSLFLAVSVLALLGTANYLRTVDWSASLVIFGTQPTDLFYP